MAKKLKSLEDLQKKDDWLGMTDEDYANVAEELVDLAKKEELRSEIFKKISAYDYVKLANSNQDFLLKTAFELPKYIRENYIKTLDSSTHKNINIISRVLNFISFNFFHFNQANFAKQTKLLDPQGECRGLTGAWLVTDQFYNKLRQELNTNIDASNMPLIRQIGHFQRSEAMRQEYIEKLNTPPVYDDSNKSEITQNIVDEIVSDKSKDRIQFFMSGVGADVGHTTGMRINHLKDNQFSLTYYDANFGEKRSPIFTTDADGKAKAARFIETALDFTHRMSVNADQVSVGYIHSSCKELEQKFEKHSKPTGDFKVQSVKLKEQLCQIKNGDSSVKAEKIQKYSTSLKS